MWWSTESVLREEGSLWWEGFAKREVLSPSKPDATYSQRFSYLFLTSVLCHCWLGSRKGVQPVKTEWWGTGVVICLEWGANICVWSSWCHCHPIISCSSKIQNCLPFWCRLAQVVLERRPLNGCSSLFICWDCTDGCPGWCSVPGRWQRLMCGLMPAWTPQQRSRQMCPLQGTVSQTWVDTHTRPHKMAELLWKCLLDEPPA